MIKNWKYSKENRDIIEKVIKKFFPEVEDKFKVDFESDDILNVVCEFSSIDQEIHNNSNRIIRIIIDHSKKHPFIYIMDSNNFSFQKEKDIMNYLENI